MKRGCFIRNVAIAIGGSLILAGCEDGGGGGNNYGDVTIGMTEAEVIATVGRDPDQRDVRAGGVTVLVYRLGGMDYYAYYIRNGTVAQIDRVNG